MPPATAVQPRPTRDPALDGLRGLAILLVFLFHYGGGLSSRNLILRALGLLTQAGWIGLNLFFALSGLLITGLLFDNLGGWTNLRNFFARRALRTLPLYYAALLAAALAALLTGAHLAQLRPLCFFAGFLQNLPYFSSSASPTPPPLPLYHLWSLAVEEQFYLLWAFLLPVRKRRQALGFCLVIFVATCIFRLLFCTSPEAAAPLASTLPVRAGALALGGAVAMLRRTRPGTSLRLPALVLVAVSLLGILLFALVERSLVLHQPSAFTVLLPLVDLLCAGAVALTLEPGLWRSLAGIPLLAFFGRISYGFYVLHILLQPLFDRSTALFTGAHSGMRYQIVRAAVALPLTTLAAWLSFTSFERRFLRLKRFFPRQTSVEMHKDPKNAVA